MLAGWGQIDPPNPQRPAYRFLKNVSCVERVEPWFFVTFNIIIKHIFHEHLIEFLQVVQKI